MALHGHKGRRVAVIGAGPWRASAAIAGCSRVPNDTPALHLTMTTERLANSRRPSLGQKELCVG